MKREEIVVAPVVGGIIAIFTFFVLHSIAGLENMTSDIAGIQFGLMISLFAAVVVGGVVFGELLADALGKR